MQRIAAEELLLALYWIDAWTTAVLYKLFVQERRKGTKQMQYGGLFYKMLGVTTSQLIETARGFFDYKGHQSLGILPCSDLWKDRKQGILKIEREAEVSFN